MKQYLGIAVCAGWESSSLKGEADLRYTEKLANRINSFRQLVARCLLLMIALPLVRGGDTDSDKLAQASLKTLDLEELSQIEVTTPSKQPVKASQTPAAIFVITGEDIRKTLEFMDTRTPALQTIVQQTSLPHNKHGAIQVERDMSVTGFPGVWAIGDCAAIPDGSGGFYPQTAQQRCWVHKTRNVLDKVPERLKAEVHRQLKEIQASSSRGEAVTQIEALADCGSCTSCR